MNWISVKNRLPKSNRNKLYIVKTPERDDDKASFCRGKWYWDFDFANFYPIYDGRVTHWKNIKDL